MMIRRSDGMSLQTLLAPGKLREADGAFVVDQLGGVSPLGGTLCSLGTDYAVQIAPDGTGRSTLGPLDITPIAGTGKAWYLKDLQSGELWSIPFSPVGERNQQFEVSYLPAQAVISSLNHKIAAEITIAVAPDSPCELWRIRIENRSAEDRSLAFTTLIQPSVGSGLETKYVGAQQTLIARRALQACGADERTAGRDPVLFHCSTLTPSDFETDKASFFGEGRTLRNPYALTDERSEGTDGLVDEAVLSLTVNIDLPIEGEAEFAFSFGVADSVDAALDIAKRVGRLKTVTSIIRESRKHWATACSTVTANTPDSALNALINTWLPYEAYAGWVAQRTGGIVFDQSQVIDRLRRSRALMGARPDVCRESLVDFASSISAAGAYSAEDDIRIVPTADELLWLVSCAAAYVAETGDFSVLDATLVLPDGIILTLREQCERVIRRCVGHEQTVKDAALLDHAMKMWNLVAPDSSVVQNAAKSRRSDQDDQQTDMPGDRSLPRRVDYLQSLCTTLADPSVANLLNTSPSAMDSPTGESCGLYCTLVEQVMGVTPTPGGLRLDPKMPDSWDGFDLTRRFRGDTYEIHVRRADRAEAGISLVVDGEPVLGDTVPFAGDGSTHVVEVTV